MCLADKHTYCCGKLLKPLGQSAYCTELQKDANSPCRSIDLRLLELCFYDFKVYVLEVTTFLKGGETQNLENLLKFN